MTYEEIYSQFYSKKTDPTFFKKYSKDEAYELMCSWLHSVAGEPYIRRCFSSLLLDDELNELTFELVNSVDKNNKDADKDFVKEIFAQGMVICWMRPQIDRNLNLAVMVGGKEEKSMLNNYKNNNARLNTLEKNLKKFIRDHGYFNNDYIRE